MPEPAVVTRTVEWPAPQWVDLFYDLAFAAGIIAISGSFAADHSAGGALWFATAYALLGCTWVMTGAATAAFTTRPRTTTTVTVMLLVIQMAAVLLLAVASGDTIADSSGLFDALLAVVLAICLVLTLRTRPGRAQLAPGPPVLMGVGILALGASWTLSGSVAFLLWIGALAAVGTAAGLAVKDLQVDSQRLTHRLGELTLIIVGEILVKMALTAGDDTVWSVQVVALVPVLTILTTTWWAARSAAVSPPIID